MSQYDHHHDWLSLIEISGPFLAVPVLKEAFPQGLEELDAAKRKRLRQAYEEWREALELEDAQFAELHVAWIDEVLSRGLELDEDGKGDVLKRADWCAANLKASLPEHGVTLSPDLAVIDEQRAKKPLLLIQSYAQDVDLDATLKRDGWASTPADRMVQICRALGCRLGLVTNGERWMLVDAPVGAVTTFASWYARIWSQEPITLQAFVHLLGIRRFFVDESEQLPALFDRSLKFQDEVTDALGEQVRRAVEVLIQTLDKADQDRNRELLHDVKEPELYEAALTVMMRLVFLLSAEERGLLLMGDERYEANYALSTLRMQLRKESEEILERRWDAWSRLLAIFRAVFGGIEHENLRLPALGGSLFDPDRFPFLEGRAKGSSWRSDAAKPLPIDNRTVLLLLEAIQQFQGRTLSYRALDVEQIGYVYEGLLERTVKRTDEVTLELDATKSAKSPWVKLAELDSARLDGVAQLAELLQERSGSSASRVRNDLAKPVDDTLDDRLLTACQGDTKLRDRVKPYAHLLRTDPWGYPLVYPAGAFIVTTGSDRRETGTHYTPKSLTEAIVAETLTPVAYVGPAEGTPRDQWALKSPAELLDLKICDPAMGSGAFLVQACRWLADRLVEAWSQVEASGQTVSEDGEVLNAGAAKELLPRDSEARTVIARRLIAERCLYGVDLNPLAVELAKLSIWLVTLAKGHPFGFLDHNLRCGDSLLGIHRLDQLTELSMTPGGKGQQRLFGQNIEKAVHEAIELRQRLREMPIRDIRDVEAMAHLDTDARRRLEVAESIADAFIGEVIASGGGAPENALASLAIRAEQAIDGDGVVLAQIRAHSVTRLSVDLPADKPLRKPFHWALQYPEVFEKDNSGFDAVIGNPPYLGGYRITGVLGTAYREYLVKEVSQGARGSADLAAYFVLIASLLIREGGVGGILATNTIAEGDTREVGLDRLVLTCVVYSASTNKAWPGKASVVTSQINFIKGSYFGEKYINGNLVSNISSALRDEAAWEIHKLKENHGFSFEGCKPYGMGFTLTPDAAREIIERNGKNRDCLFPFLNGDDLNSSPTQSASRWAINFWDWPEERAKSYPELFAILDENVRPERQRLKPNGEYALRRPLPNLWWIYGEKRPAMFHAIGRHQFFEKHPKNVSYPDQPLERVIASTRTTKYVAATFFRETVIFDQGLIVFPLKSAYFITIMHSSIYDAWVRKCASSLGSSTVYYNPTDCFDTFPFPSKLPVKESRADFGDEILLAADIMGEKYHALRAECMVENNFGLTKFYNAFHNPSEKSSRLEELRSLQCQMDLAIMQAYGWTDLSLNHGFQEVSYLPENDRIRFTISEAARLEVLRRLSELNRQRNEAEDSKCLNGNSTARTLIQATRGGRTAPLALIQPSLDFESGAAMPINGVTSATVILGFLNTNSGWHAKTDVLAATGITDGQWNAAITDLVAGGKVERRGERRGARYRAIDTGGATQ
jgi:hypothetical protein